MEEQRQTSGRKEGRVSAAKQPGGGISCPRGNRWNVETALHEFTCFTRSGFTTSLVGMKIKGKYVEVELSHEEPRRLEEDAGSPVPGKGTPDAGDAGQFYGLLFTQTAVKLHNGALYGSRPKNSAASRCL